MQCQAHATGVRALGALRSALPGSIVSSHRQCNYAAAAVNFLGSMMYLHGIHVRVGSSVERGELMGKNSAASLARPGAGKAAGPGILHPVGAKRL